MSSDSFESSTSPLNPNHRESALSPELAELFTKDTANLILHDSILYKIEDLESRQKVPVRNMSGVLRNIYVTTRIYFAEKRLEQVKAVTGLIIEEMKKQAILDTFQEELNQLIDY
jgi:hypothetical protein